MKAFVTGSRGFLGRHLVAKLREEYSEPTQYDRAIDDAMDIRNSDLLASNMLGSDIVFHLAANASVRNGWESPERDVAINTVGTSNVLRAMKAADVRRIVYVSSSAVYGSGTGAMVRESDPLPQQSSLYGASKVAAEALVQAYCSALGFTGYIFRPVPILGEHYHYGHVFDFVKQLNEHPDHLDVMGTGRQLKSYVYAGDLVDAMLRVSGAHQETACETYNVAANDQCLIYGSAHMVASAMGLNPKLRFDGKTWAGDNQTLRVSTTKIRNTGWKAKVSIPEAYRRTVQWIQENHFKK